MKPKYHNTALSLITAAFVLPHTALAQTYTWDGGGTDDLFGTATNWSSDTAPVPSSSTILNFGGGTRTTPVNNYSSADSFSEWHLINTATADFTISGTAFGLYGKIENDSGSNHTLTVNTATIYSTDGSIEINPVGGNINIGSIVALDGNASLNVYDGGFNHTLYLNGVVSKGNGTGGNGSLILNQTSTVVLTADGNDYGTTTLNTGTKLQVGNGGTTGSLGSGNITNNGQLIFNRTADQTVSNVISGSGTLSKQGTNILTLSGTNSYTGITSINAGTLAISAETNLGSTPGSYVANQISINGATLKTTATLNISASRGITIGTSGATLDNSSVSNNLSINSKITGSGPLTLKAYGNTSDSGGGNGGNLTLGNTNNDFTGNVTIQSGLVNFASDAAFGNSANTITIAGGGLVSTANNSLAASRSIILSGGGDKIFRTYGSATLTVNGVISGTGNVRHTDGGTLVLNGANTFTGNLINVAGTLTVKSANAYTGYTFVSNSSTLKLDADNVLPDATDCLLYNGTTFNVNGKNETIGGLMVGSSGDTSVNINLGASGATGTLTITDNTMPSGSLTNAGANFYGKLTGVGSVEYKHTISNTALWDWLNTANDFIGNVIVTQGRLRTDLGTGGAGAFGNATNDIVFNGDIVTDLSNGKGKASIQGASGGALNFGVDRSIILNDGKEGTMYVWGGNTYTINGKITGGGNLRKEDGGILILNNTTSDYTGLTRIASGTIRIGAAGVIPDASGVEIASGGLDLNSLNETVASLSGNGGSVSGGSTLTVLTSDNATYSGSILSSTTLRMAGNGSQTLSGTSDNSGATAQVDSGTLILAKTSSGSVHAVGANNAPGLTINGGTARLGGTGGDQIYTGSNVHMTGGTFDLNQRSEGFRGLTGTAGNIRNDGATASTLILGEGSLSGDNYVFDGTITNGSSTVALTKTGSGKQTLNGNNTYTGNTTINGGTLALGASGSIASSTQIIVGATTTLDVSATGGWTLGAAQTLSGNGTIVGNSTIAGDIRPGSSPGTLTITGNLGLNSGSNWHVELGGTGITDYDRLLISGELSSSGNILVSLVNSFNPALNDSFQIASFASFAGSGGTFSFVSAPLDSGLSWDTSTFSTNGIITVIPEPTTYLISSMGIILFALRRRR